MAVADPGKMKGGGSKLAHSVSSESRAQREFLGVTPTSGHT